MLNDLKQPTSVADLHVLRGQLSGHLDAIEEESFEFEFLELDLARKIAICLNQLLDIAATFDADQRSTLRAAVTYFVKADDEENDFESPIGMEDDAEVVNEACRILGRPDLVIKSN